MKKERIVFKVVLIITFLFTLNNLFAQEANKNIPQTEERAYKKVEEGKITTPIKHKHYFETKSLNKKTTYNNPLSLNNVEIYSSEADKIEHNKKVYYSETYDFSNKKYPAELDMYVDFGAIQDHEDPNSILSLSDFIGKDKYVIVDFWASWCAPCLQQIPTIRNAYHELPKDRVTFLSVAVNDRYIDSKKAIEKYQIEWDVLLNVGNTPMLLYGFTSIPQLLIIAPDGTIIKKGLKAEQLLEYTASILKNNPPLQSPNNAVRSLTYQLIKQGNE